MCQTFFKMGNFTFSFGEGEIILAGTVLELTTARPVSTDTAQKGVILEKDGKSLGPQVTAEGSVIKVQTQGLGTGRYQIRISDLKDVQGKNLEYEAPRKFTIDAL